ncbi:DUF6453 family protein [Leminorella grimontii]|uniref:DUF6453 family protein n=1 Tax=Leminorella grimontii TaxID=82981 RepID=UPI0032208C48
MDEYGVIAFPDIGNAVTLTAGSRAMSYLGYYEVGIRNNSGSFSVPNKTAGSTLYLVPIMFGTMIDGGAWAQAAVVDSLSINDNVVNFHVNNHNLITVKFAAFEILGVSTTTSTYGVILSDSSNYMELNSNTAGCCVWRGSVNINGAWSVPTTIPARQNAVVFANWSDPNAALTFDNASKQIRCYAPDGKSASVWANVCVFTSGFNLELPMYGDAIFNEAGQCTYSSLYAPIFLAGVAALNKTPGTWTACPVSAPLIPVGSVGAMRTGSGGKDYYLWSRCGVKMYNGSIAGGPGEYLGSFKEAGAASYSCVSPVSFPVLNLSDYF